MQTPPRADRQKDRLYAWEDSWRAWGRNTHTLAQLRTAIREACAHFGVEAPAVVQHNKRSLSWSTTLTGDLTGKDVISLQAVGPLDRGGKNMAVAMHEASHHIVVKLHGLRPADHGPIFLGVYLSLLEAAGLAPRSALYASAREHGLRWVECKS